MHWSKSSSALLPVNGVKVLSPLFGLKENVDFGTTFVRRLTFCTSFFFFLNTGLWENRFQPYGDGKPKIFLKKNIAFVLSEVKRQLLVEKHILLLRKQIKIAKENNEMISLQKLFAFD